MVMSQVYRLCHGSTARGLGKVNENHGAPVEVVTKLDKEELDTEKQKAN